MKQRFSSLDVKVIAHELSETVVGLRLSNVYDLSSKIFLFRFARPNEKRHLVVDTGFRAHLTEFARATGSVPSDLVARFRKLLRTRRVTAVSQIGTDRILEFRFSDGAYRMYLEFFASGNIIVTDAEQKILLIMRNVPESENQEAQRVGLTYSLDSRQNYAGVPPMTRDRLENALKIISGRAAAAGGGPKKGKAKDILKKGLATTMTELPPILLDHALLAGNFPPTAPVNAILESEDLVEQLLRCLADARQVIDNLSSSAKCTGYIIAKPRPKGDEGVASQEGEPTDRKDVLYEDFQPFLPLQFTNPEQYISIPIDGYNKTVDEFFSSLEGQKLESRLTEKEATAKRKLDAARADQIKRLEGLQEVQTLNLRKAAAIEANVARVQEAMDAINGLILQGMDWVNIGKLVEREQQRDNPVAAVIKLPLKLAENTITLLLGEEEDDADADEADFSDDDDEDEDDESVAPSKSKAEDKRLAVDISLDLSPWSNAREYYDEKRTAAAKEQKTAEQASRALRNAEAKITEDLRRGLKQEKPVLQPLRRAFWFEKFTWFVSSDGHLVLGGRDAQQNELLYRRYLRRGDAYVHADLHGAASIVVKNRAGLPPDSPIPPTTLTQAGNLAVCSSSAWDSKAAMSAWWVAADQVSKSAPTGEYLPTGSFVVRGRKNFLPAAQLVMGFAVAFKISDESVARHVKHRLFDAAQEGGGKGATSRQAGAEDADVGMEEEEFGKEEEPENESEEEEDREDERRVEYNPLQSGEGLGNEDGEGGISAGEGEDEAGSATAKLESLQIEGKDDHAQAENDEAAPADIPDEDEARDSDGDDGDDATSSVPASTGKASATGTGSGTGRPQAQPASKKQQPPKRGQRAKAKKAARYRDQDDEDRAAVEAVTGVAAGRKRAEAEAAARAAREAANKLAQERKAAAEARRREEGKKFEEARRRKMELDGAGAGAGAGAEGATGAGAGGAVGGEGVVAAVDEDGEMDDEAALLESAQLLDALVGTPLAGDEILFAVPVCAPWGALARFKYKAKLQPGSAKKGKAVKEVLDRWKAAAGAKGVVDETATDKERMWPREVQLIKALKPEEVVGCVPVGKVRLMMAGGGGGGGGGQGKGGQAKGGPKGGKSGGKKK